MRFQIELDGGVVLVDSDDDGGALEAKIEQLRALCGSADIVERDDDELRVRFAGEFDEDTFLDVSDALVELCGFGVAGHVDVSRDGHAVARRYTDESLEWLVDEQAVDELGATRLGSSAFLQPRALSTMAISADGKVLVAGDCDRYRGAMSLWDTDSGARRGHFGVSAPQGDEFIRLGDQLSVGLTADGKRAFVGGMSDKLRVFDVPEARLERTLAVNGSVSALAVSHSEEVLAVALDRFIEIRDLNTLEVLRNLSATHDSIDTLQWSSDGALLATSWRGIELWTSLKDRPVTLPGSPTHAAFLSDGRIASVKAFDNDDSHLQLLAKDGQEILESKKLARMKPSYITQDPTTDDVIVATEGALCFWDTDSNEVTSVEHDFRVVAGGVYRSDIRGLLLNVGMRRPVRLDLESRTFVEDGFRQVWSVRVNPDGDTMVLRFEGLEVRDARSAVKRFGVPQLGVSFYPAAVAPDGEVVVTFGDRRDDGPTKTVLVALDARTGETLLERVQPWTSALTFAAHGRELAIFADERLQFVDVVTGEVVRRTEKTYDGEVRVSPDQTRALIKRKDAVELIDVNSAQSRGVVGPFEDEVTAAVFSPDSTKCALACGKDLRIVDFDTNEELVCERVDWSNDMSYSPDGELIVLAQSGAVTVVDAGSGEVKSRHYCHRQSVDAVGAYQDGTMFSISSDGTALLWESLSGPAAVDAAESAPSRELFEEARAHEDAAQKAREERARLDRTEEVAPWPPEASEHSPRYVRQSAEQASSASRENFSELRANGWLLFADEDRLERGLKRFDESAYVEFYGAADWTRKGLRLDIDLKTELPVDCVDYRASFEAICREAFFGNFEVWSGWNLSGYHFSAPESAASIVPELVPGALARFGEVRPRRHRYHLESEDHLVVGAEERWDSPLPLYSFDRNTWELVATLNGEEGGLFLADPAGDVFCTGPAPGMDYDLNGSLKFYDVSFSLLSEIPVAGVDSDHVVLSPNQPQVAFVVFADDDTMDLEVWDYERGERVLQLENTLEDFAFIGQERMLLKGKWPTDNGEYPHGECVTLIDKSTGEVVSTISLRKPPRDLVSGPHTDVMGVTTEEGLMGLSPTGEELWNAPVDRDVVGDATGFRIGDIGEITRHISTDGEPLSGEHQHRVESVAVLQGESPWLLSLDDSGLLLVRDLQSGEFLHREHVHRGRLCKPKLVASSTGSKVAVCGGEGVLVLDRNAPTWTRYPNAATAEFIGERLILVGHDGEIDGQTFGDVPILDVQFAGDDRLLVKDAHGGTMLLAVAADGALVQTDDKDWITEKFDYHGTACALSADGALLAATSGRTIELFDAETGEQTGVLDGHAQGVLALAFSGDGHLVSGSADQTVIVWSVEAIDAIGGGHDIHRDTLCW